ncbi:MAG TPA: hypothetical protein VIN34_09090 [Candidatus Limnocylindria bacterium]|jgi:hypothetical protein
MRALFAAILILVLGAAIAAGAYEAGLAQSGAQIVIPAAGAAPAAGAPAVAYYGHPHGWGWGFGFFGFLFPLFGLLLFFGLMRALVGGGRGWGHRGWNGDAITGRFEEWHRRAHGDTAPATDRSAPPHQ